MAIIKKDRSLYKILFIPCIFLGICFHYCAAETDNFLKIVRHTKKNTINVVSNATNGEKELRILFKGILFMETKAFSGTPCEMHFKRITDGNRIVQSVVQDATYKDCDYSENSTTISDFFQEFSRVKSLFHKRSKQNVFDFYDNVDAIGFSNLPFKSRRRLGRFKDLVKINREVRLCHKFMKKIKKNKQGRKYKKIKNKNDIELRNPAIGLYQRKLKGDSITENRARNNDGYLNRKNGGSRKRRSKRSFFNKYLMFPGTKWCGRGQIAEEYNELGEDKEADVCCREHDCCTGVIYSFEWRYNYFNYRFHSILHCDCDKRFRGCLKQSLSPMASLIGKIYFNIMGSKCFTLVPQEVCKSRTWWGTCAEYEKKLVAQTEDQEPYDYCSTT